MISFFCRNRKECIDPKVLDKAVLDSKYWEAQATDFTSQIKLFEHQLSTERADSTVIRQELAKVLKEKAALVEELRSKEDWVHQLEQLLKDIAALANTGEEELEPQCKDGFCEIKKPAVVSSDRPKLYFNPPVDYDI